MYRRSKERYCSKNRGKHISISEQHVSMKIFFLEIKKTLFKGERESCRESTRQNFHSCERRGHRRTAAQASPSLPPTTTSPEKKERKKKTAAILGTCVLAAVSASAAADFNQILFLLFPLISRE